MTTNYISGDNKMDGQKKVDIDLLLLPTLIKYTQKEKNMNLYEVTKLEKIIKQIVQTSDTEGIDVSNLDKDDKKYLITLLTEGIENIKGKINND